MKIGNALRRMMTALLLIFLLVPASAPAFAAEGNQRQTIRVGCVDIDNFLTLTNGFVTGYGADYLREISSYTGWDYEYVPGTWSECLQWLRDGEIDLLLPAEYTAQRAEDFLFSSLECCIDFVALQTDKNSSLYYEDFENYNGITVGMIRDNYLNECFDQYATENGFTYRPRYYETGAALSAALADRAVDAIVSGNMEIDTNTRIIAKFDYMPAYFITGKANTALMESLNEAMYCINLENPYFTSELYHTYYAPFVSQSKVFSREESEYIAKAKPLRVVCDSDNVPFEWYDEVTGSYKGIDIDILNLVAERAGMTLEFVRSDSLLHSWKMMQNGEADLIAGVYLDEKLMEEYRVNATVSYTDEGSNAVFRRGEALTLADIHTVALRESFIGTAEYIRTKYPEWTIVTYPDSDACLKAVENSQADITFVGTYRLQTEMVLDQYPQLAVLPGVSINVPMMLGVSADAPPILCSVLNKGIRTISQNEKQQIIANNTLVQLDHITLERLIREHPVAIILAVVAVLLVAAGCAFLVYHSNVQKKYAASLKTKNDELTCANQAVNTFFSQLSHDMRTPMNAVLCYSEFGLESQSEDESKEYFQKIRDSGQYLLTLINDTLEISKIDTGKLELHPEPYLCTDFVFTIRNLLDVKAKQKGVAFEIVDNITEFQTALFDKTHLQQILMNLLNNAIKFTPRGGTVRLQIDPATCNGDQTAVCFIVSDTGIGISPEFLREKLYTPFEQERRKETCSEIGTGLGLSIVKSLVALMNGTISCESEMDKGTIFRVVIPTTFLPTNPETPTVRIADYSKLIGKHILLCEDHPLNQEIMGRLLAKRQVITQTAENGEMGLALFGQSEEGYYDAILMDLRMPVMDGIETARAIRALDRADAKTVPIIAITANVFDVDIQQCKDAGMNAHLAKPIEPEKLYQMLLQWID